MRMKRIVTCILLVIFHISDIAYPFIVQSDKIVIAVVDFRNTGADRKYDYLEKTIPETIITKMASSGHLEIVERALLQEALKEMELGETGIVDEQTAVEVGRAVGASAILLGSFVAIGEVIRINARLINVQTSKIIKAENVQGGVDEEIFQLMDQLAASMENQLRGDTGKIIQYQQIPMVKKEDKKVTKGKPFYNTLYKLGGGLSVASENDNVEGGNGFSAFIDYPLQNSMTIKTSIGKYSSDTKVDKLSKGDYSLLWIECSLLFSGTKSKIQPYGGGGGGYYMFTHDLSSNLKNAYLQMGIRVKEEIQNTFGIHIRGGANVEISPTLQLNADVKYVFLKPKAEAKATILSTNTSATSDVDLELNTMIISIGLRVNF